MYVNHDNCISFGENGEKWIWCANQALFFAGKTKLKSTKSLIKTIRDIFCFPSRRNGWEKRVLAPTMKMKRNRKIGETLHEVYDLKGEYIEKGNDSDQ